MAKSILTADCRRKGRLQGRHDRSGLRQSTLQWARSARAKPFAGVVQSTPSATLVAQGSYDITSTEDAAILATNGRGHRPSKYGSKQRIR